MILVDAAIWPWRGRRWAHLVSDSNLAELHQFAAHLGLRRAAFQGDHYDIDEGRRLDALAAGAIAVESRDLVRRLRSAGLRTRQGLAPWHVLKRFTTDSVAEATEQLAVHIERNLAGLLAADVAAVAEESASAGEQQRGDATTILECIVLRRTGELLVSLGGAGMGPEPVRFHTGAMVHVSWDSPIRTVEILFAR